MFIGGNKCTSSVKMEKHTPLNINVATREELEGLHGIGEGYAKRILELRGEVQVLTLQDFSGIPKLQTKLSQLQRDEEIAFGSVETATGDQPDDFQSDQGSDSSSMTESRVRQLIGNALHEVHSEVTKNVQSYLVQEMDNFRQQLAKDREIMEDSRRSSEERLFNRLEQALTQIPPAVPVPPKFEPSDPVVDRGVDAIRRNAPPLPARLQKSQDARLDPPVSSGDGQRRDYQARRGSPMSSGDNYQDSGARRGPLIPNARPNFPKINPYDGTTDFHAFIMKFDILAESYGWNDQVKRVKLVESLTGKALDCFAWQKIEVRANFHLIREQLEKMFGKLDDPMIHRAEIGVITQRGDESIVQYGQRVRELAAKAYPNAESDLFETLSIEAFSKGCTDSDASKLAMLKDPKTLNDAIQFTRTASYNDQVIKRHKFKNRRVHYDEELQQDVDSVRVRQVQGTDMTSLNNAMQEMSNNLKMLCSRLGVSRESTGDSPLERGENSNRRSRSPTRQGGANDGKCYNCGAPGHFSRDCPQPKKERSRSPSPSGLAAGSLN